MTSRVAWWGAWSLALVTGLIAITQVVLEIVDPASSYQSRASDVPDGGVPIAAFEAVVLITIAIIGSIVAARQPRNVVGWILCVIPLSLGVLIVASHVYWRLQFHDIGSDRLAAIVAWLGSWTWVPVMIPTVTFFPLLFPTGRPLTPRWRPIVWMAGVTLVLVLFSELFRPGRLQEFPVDNPFGIDLAAGVFVVVSDVIWVTTTVAAMTSLVIRFRRSHGDERQQIKWVALAALMFVLLFVLSAVIQDLQGEDGLGFAILLAGLLLIASAVALAMLRYRLYDIDVVINRALVYGLLTTLLAGVYLGSVLLLQVVLEGFTGGSGLAVAASTLGTAALFGPLRTRVQGVVDRRFFRRKYDAAQTLQRFGASVRDEVDLEALTAELRTVIAETMQPAHLSLWVHTRESSR
jgi:hypothetical protein